MTFKTLGRVCQLKSGRSSETELVTKVVKVQVSELLLTSAVKCGCSEA